jgi:hypothetical protein
MPPKITSPKVAKRDRRDESRISRYFVVLVDGRVLKKYAGGA